MFGRPRSTVGLDIGSSHVKVVEVERKGAEARLVNFGVAPLGPEAIVDGEIMDRQMVVETIQNLFEERGIRRKRVTTGVHGRGVIVKKIVMERLSEEDAAEAIHWEAEQHVPYDINDVALDFEILGVDVGPDRMQVLLVAARRDLVLTHAEIVREAGLVPEAIDVNCFAAQTAAELNLDLHPEEVVAVLDIGAEITNVNVFRDGIPLYTQDVSIGGNRLVESMQKRLQINRDEALTILEQGEESSTGPLLGEFSDGLLQALQKSLTYLRSSEEIEKLDRILLSGGCARLPGLIDALRSGQEAEVEILDPTRRLARAPDAAVAEEELEKVGPQLAVGIGLALRKGGKP